MTTLIMIVLTVISYMLIYWLYSAANELCRRGKKQLILDTIQVGIYSYDGDGAWRTEPSETAG